MSDISDITDEIDAYISRRYKEDGSFRAFVEESPENLFIYRRRLIEKRQEVWKCPKINPAYCMTCANAYGQPPFEDAPEKGFCAAFPHNKGIVKPREVFFDGAECKFYKKKD